MDQFKMYFPVENGDISLPWRVIWVISPYDFRRYSTSPHLQRSLARGPAMVGFDGSLFGCIFETCFEAVEVDIRKSVGVADWFWRYVERVAIKWWKALMILRVDLAFKKRWKRQNFAWDFALEVIFHDISPSWRPFQKHITFSQPHLAYPDALDTPTKNEDLKDRVKKLGQEFDWITWPMLFHWRGCCMKRGPNHGNPKMGPSMIPSPSENQLDYWISLVLNSGT